MSKLPVLKAREIVAALLKAGFTVHHQAGSHVRLRHRLDAALHVTVPMHSGDVPRTTLRRIIAQAGLTVAEFLELL